MSVRLRVATFTTLYPRSERPRHGIFVATRIAHFRRWSGAEVRVIAPVPAWPPLRSTAAAEVRDGIEVQHPRYFHVPGAGMYSAPFALAACAQRALQRLLRDGFDFDVLDAHYLYPDGVAAALVARRFGRPLVLTARGSDVNLLPQYRVPRRLIALATARADAVVTVSEALARSLRALGVDAAKLCVLRNGVDTELFQPVARAAARAQAGWRDAPTLLCVGNLVPEKGFELVVEALAQLPGTDLVIIGSGPGRAALEACASRFGVKDRVRFEAERTQRDLAVAYSAADALVLASSREGWPNVLLESMACGTPVVATPVGGVPEIVTAAAAGRVAQDRTVAGIVRAVRDLLAAPPPPAETRRDAERFGWTETARGQTELFERLARTRRTAGVEALAAH